MDVDTAVDWFASRARRHALHRSGRGGVLNLRRHALTGPARKVEPIAKRTKQVKLTNDERSYRRAVRTAKARSSWSHEKSVRQAFEGLPGFASISDEIKENIDKEIKDCKDDARGDAWQTVSLAVLNGEDPLSKVRTFKSNEREWRHPIIKRVGNIKTRAILLCNDATVNNHKLPSLRCTGQKDSIFDDDPHRDTRASYIKWATDSFDG